MTQHNSDDGYLKSYETPFELHTKDLEIHRKFFFFWVMNLSILKSYNALELFILQVIQLSYFPTLQNPINGKKQADEVQKQIKNYLLNNNLQYDTKNNRHIIQFLKYQSAQCCSFLDHRMRIDLKTNWENFFELFSILRNIIAHQGIILNSDIHNEIK